MVGCHDREGSESKGPRPSGDQKNALLFVSVLAVFFSLVLACSGGVRMHVSSGELYMDLQAAVYSDSASCNFPEHVFESLVGLRAQGCLCLHQ